VVTACLRTTKEGNAIQSAKVMPYSVYAREK
jgi:hypothetical protein